MKNAKKLLLGLFMLSTLVCIFCVGASAATEYNINKGSVTLSNGGDYVIRGNGTSTSNIITINNEKNKNNKVYHFVKDGDKVVAKLDESNLRSEYNITLENVHISSSEIPIKIAPYSTVNLTLKGNNILHANNDSYDKAMCISMPKNSIKFNITKNSTGSLAFKGKLLSETIYRVYSQKSHSDALGYISISGGTVDFKDVYVDVQNLEINDKTSKIVLSNKGQSATNIILNNVDMDIDSLSGNYYINNSDISFENDDCVKSIEALNSTIKFKNSGNRTINKIKLDNSQILESKSLICADIVLNRPATYINASKDIKIIKNGEITLNNATINCDNLSFTYTFAEDKLKGAKSIDVIGASAKINTNKISGFKSITVDKGIINCTSLTSESLKVSGENAQLNASESISVSSLDVDGAKVVSPVVNYKDIVLKNTKIDNLTNTGSIFNNNGTIVGIILLAVILVGGVIAFIIIKKRKDVTNNK